MIKTQVSEFVEDAESMRLFEQERIILDVTERICDVMEENNVNRVQLAYALGKSKGYISQLLDGSANMTLRTLSDVFLALGLRAFVHTEPLHQWSEGRLTLVHDEEPEVWSWQPRWELEMAQNAPPPASVGACESEVLAA